MKTFAATGAFLATVKVARRQDTWQGCTDTAVPSDDLNVVSRLAATKNLNRGTAGRQLPRSVCQLEANAEAVCLGTLVPLVARYLCVLAAFKQKGVWSVISLSIYIGQ